MVKVLFVCLGNICRSPTAHGVFRQLVKQQKLDGFVVVDSAGTHAYHVGEKPDSRSMQLAKERGVRMDDLRARKAVTEDFYVYDYILAMDSDNLHNLQNIAPVDGKAHLALMLDYAAKYSERNVPDPYYGGSKGFETVFDMVEDASIGLLAKIRQQHGF